MASDLSAMAEATAAPKFSNDGYAPGGGGTSPAGTYVANSPYAPQYIPQAAAQVGSNVQQATQGAASAQQNLQSYIQHLYALQQVARRAAGSMAARGANSQQNPLAVFNSVKDAAAQAGIPMDAQISQTLQQSNNIQNTLNNLLTGAAQQYTQLGSIGQGNAAYPQSKGEVLGGGGGGGASTGSRPAQGRGGANAGGEQGGGYTNIRGDVSPRRGAAPTSINQDWLAGTTPEERAASLQRLSGTTSQNPQLQAEQNRLLNLVGPAPTTPGELTSQGPMSYGDPGAQPGMQFSPTPLNGDMTNAQGAPAGMQTQFGSLPNTNIGTQSLMGQTHNNNIANYPGGDIHNDQNAPFNPATLGLGNENQWGVPNFTPNAPNAPAAPWSGSGPADFSSAQFNPNVGTFPGVTPTSSFGNDLLNTGSNIWNSVGNAGNDASQAVFGTNLY